MVFKLTQITFHAAEESQGEASPVTILVGPNNSGKSLALREIMLWAQGDDRERRVVDQLDADWPTSVVDVLEQLEPFATEPEEGEAPQEDAILIAPFKVDGSKHRVWVQRGTLSDQLQQGSASTWLRKKVLSHFTARLDGRTRFDLMQPRPIQDQQVTPQHHLAALFMDDSLREQVREIVASAFPGRYFVIDPTSMQQFRVRISGRPPEDPSEERNWDARAVEFHANAEPLEELSDGVVSFTGLLAAIVSLPHRILLVDEPEAFLHPPLARLLGSNLASLTREREASLVAATHSSEFVLGCIDSGAETTIVRLTYEQGIGGARMLAPAELKELSRNPLLRSTRALSGLFHRGVVVGESDHDRAFYDEINRRLVEADRGTRDTFFTNAQNWQTIPRVIGPLRKLGVPAAGIVDLDAITQTKAEWNKFYGAMNLDDEAIQCIDSERRAVTQLLEDLPKDSEHPSYKKVGISTLAQGEMARAEALFETLAKYGIFVVPVGALEGWLESLELSRGDKAKWIVKAFDKLGVRPGRGTYVPPGEDDVWEFMDRVAAWIDDPERLGLPE